MSGRAGVEEWLKRLAAAGVDGEAGCKLAVYLDLLCRFGKAADLTGQLGGEELLRHHVLESLAGASLLPAVGTLLDVGSGAGFPGIPLLVARPQLRGMLLEPRERRWAFLAEVIRELGLEAEVRRERVREHSRRGYATLLVRALPPREWAGEVERLLTGDGLLLWWTKLGAREGGKALPGLVHVLSSPLPDRRRGNVTVWRRRST